MSRSFSIGSPKCLIISSTFLCEQLLSLMIRKKIFEVSGRTNTNNESSKNTNVKSEINKVSKNKRCQFLENIVSVNETSEHNSNGYCNVDFVLTLNPTLASFICGIKVIFSIMNLYLFLTCIPYDPKSHCGLTCVVSVIFCAVTCTVTELASDIVNASSKELQLCVFGRNLYDTDETNSNLEIRLTPILSSFLGD